MPIFLIKQAAGLPGVSTDILRRWVDRGRVEITTDGAGRLAVDGAALAQQLAESADHGLGGMVVAHSRRNRFPGLVTWPDGIGSTSGGGIEGASCAHAAMVQGRLPMGAVAVRHARRSCYDPALRSASMSQTVADWGRAERAGRPGRGPTG
jgi:hypothetical protein